MSSLPKLYVVMYHYVRDLPRSRFPRIRGMLLDRFREQVMELSAHWEAATLESALAFLQGQYRPSHDLFLLTFDDGLREHYEQVTPILDDAGIQGLFFVITSCVEDERVVPVHMNHFLTAELGCEYRKRFLSRLREEDVAAVNLETARRTYPWDDPAEASFKYLFNFALAPDVRDGIVRDLFCEFLGDEQQFSRDLYFNWDEARCMQEAGMVLGGHTNEHRPLARMRDDELADDISRCKLLMSGRLREQPLWPFCYPYGKRDSYDQRAADVLRKNGFCCSFSTEPASNEPGADLFSISRIDCNAVKVNPEVYSELRA